MSKASQKLLQSEKIRFGIVGAFNTAVDFAVLFALTLFFGLPTVMANAGSTSTALAVSYLLNKRAVFRDTDSHNVRQVILFVTVTLSGLWIVQGVVITLVAAPLQTAGLNATVALFGGKVIATGFSLVWNYLWYSRVIFRK